MTNEQIEKSLQAKHFDLSAIQLDFSTHRSINGIFTRTGMESRNFRQMMKDADIPENKNLKGGKSGPHFQWN